MDAGMTGLTWETKRGNRIFAQLKHGGKRCCAGPLGAAEYACAGAAPAIDADRRARKAPSGKPHRKALRTAKARENSAIWRHSNIAVVMGTGNQGNGK